MILTHIYKIAFAINQIANIQITTSSQSFEGSEYVYKFNGSLVYALVKAKDRMQANSMADLIIKNHVSNH